MIRTVALGALALAFFLLLFPLLFFYSSAVAAGLIPAVFGGGFIVFCAAALVVLFPCVLATLSGRRGVSLVLPLAFLFLLLYVSLWLLAHAFLGGLEMRRSDVIVQWASLLICWPALFSVGYFWPVQTSPRARRLLALALAGMAGSAALHLDSNQLMYRPGADAPLTYQGLARSVAVTGIFLLATLTRPVHLWAAATGLIVTVFLVGARSELVGVGLVLALMAYGEARRRPASLLLVGSIIAAVAVPVAASLDDALSGSRQLQLFSLGDDASWASRRTLQIHAAAAVLKNPLLGDFAGHTTEGGVGNYAHNILSAWRQLGVIGFALYLFLVLVPAALCLLRFRHRPRDEAARLNAFVSAFALVLVLGAKSIFWPVPALAWGLTSRPSSTFR